MWKELRVYVVVAALVLLCVAVFITAKLFSTARLLREGERSRREQSTVIRRPNLGTAGSEDISKALNIAPLATVTVSSVEESKAHLGGGVADGIVDSQEWVTHEDMRGAWIKLSWDRPATVMEVALYDRPNRFDNVLGGTLHFEDGSVIAVPALPPGGTP
jgi:hypothetical protein